MGPKKTILLGGPLYLSLVLNLSCTSTDNADFDQEDPSEASSSDTSSSEQEASSTDPESSDEEGRKAIEASLKENSPLATSETNPSSSSPGSNPQTPGEKLLKFPKSENPEELGELLLDQDEWKQESLKNCLEELAQVTKTAKNHDSLKEATVTISTMIKDKLPEYHWCFLAGHHELNQELSGNTKTIDQKIANFQSKMTIFVALSKSLDLAVGSNRYARYNRDRYISHSRDYFGRHIKPIDDPNK